MVDTAEHGVKNHFYNFYVTIKENDDMHACLFHSYIYNIFYQLVMLGDRDVHIDPYDYKFRIFQIDFHYFNSIRHYIYVGFYYIDLVRFPSTNTWFVINCMFLNVFGYTYRLIVMDKMYRN